MYSVIYSARTSIVLAALFFCVATTQPAGAEQLTTHIPHDWTESTAGNAFSLRAPAGTQYKPGQGTDSLVGTFASTDFEITSDYGLYSDPLSQWKSNAQYNARAVEIDGKPAKLVTAYAPELAADRPYVIGLHVANVKRSTLGAVKLSLIASVASPAQFPIIKQVFGSIRFLESGGN